MRELAHELSNTTRCRVEYLPTSPPLFHKEESCEHGGREKGGDAENAMQEEEEEVHKVGLVRDQDTVMP